MIVGIYMMWKKLRQGRRLEKNNNATNRHTTYLLINKIAKKSGYNYCPKK